MTSQVVDGVTGELVDVSKEDFEMPLVEKPTLADKAMIGLGNVADKAKVELINAAVSVKEDFLQGAQNFKENLINTENKIVEAKDTFMREVNGRIADKQVEVAIQKANTAIERADQVIREAEIALQESPFAETQAFKNDLQRTNVEEKTELGNTLERKIV